MILEDQRVIHEDIERLENAVADRYRDEPKNVRDRLNRDHEIAFLLQRIQEQSSRLLKIYADTDGSRENELQSISTGDPLDSFYKQYSNIKEHHRLYPNEPVENLDRMYKRRAPDDAGASLVPNAETMFTGEEGFGRYWDLIMHHEEYLNLPGIKGGPQKIINYLQYLDRFDQFTPPQFPLNRSQKMNDAYFKYLGMLVDYMRSFMERTRPLEDLDRLFATFDAEFDEAWNKDELTGWSKEVPAASNESPTQASGAGTWCAYCEAEFKNENVYSNHLKGKKHKRAVAAREASGKTDDPAETTNGAQNGVTSSIQRLKERAVAEREFRVQKLVSVMQTVRADTRMNVERKQGMTDRERQQELAAMYAEAESGEHGGDHGESDSEGEEKIYNPLKLPLAWDGKPIPFWLYKLHGLGVEFPCEVCGNFVYMGRRAFDKHFNEPRHIWGLKALGITNTTLFREITGIEDAQKLWEKIQRDKKHEKQGSDNVIQMEDSEGNVMPEKVYYDLQKQGLL